MTCGYIDELKAELTISKATNVQFKTNKDPVLIINKIFHRTQKKVYILTKYSIWLICFQNPNTSQNTLPSKLVFSICWRNTHLHENTERCSKILNNLIQRLRKPCIHSSGKPILQRPGNKTEQMLNSLSSFPFARGSKIFQIFRAHKQQD